MSQVTDFDIPASPLTMSALATALEAVFAALGSINRGAAAPSNPFEGMLWWDSAAAAEILKRYTVTAGWVSILSINRTTGAIQLFSGAGSPPDNHVVITSTLAAHTDATSAHSATGNATPFRIPVRDASGNIKIGNAAAAADALNRVTGDGRYVSIVAGSSANYGGGISGTIYWERVGDIVMISWGPLSGSSATSFVSDDLVIPSGFRPVQAHEDAVNASFSQPVQLTISSTGRLSLFFRDWTGALANSTTASPGSTTYKAA